MISLGANVVKSACKLWLGDRQYADDVTSELVDLLGGRVSSRFEQRKIGRFFDDCADIVARRLVTLLDTEFRAVPDNERTAAVLAVGDTFAAAPLTDEALFQADVDARLVERQLRPAAAAILTKALLSGGGQGIYWLVLRESCSYLVEVVTTLPKFSSGALTELLRRETAVLDTLSRVLDRLPERRGIDDFAADYRRAVVNKLDRDGIGQWEGLTTIELFDCPQLTGFAPLTALTSLEHMSLGLLSEGSRDLSPLTSLPRLKTLSLRGQNTFDVSSLAGIRDLAITVPPRARVTGADRLGPMSRITDSEYIDSAAESQ